MIIRILLSYLIGEFEGHASVIILYNSYIAHVYYSCEYFCNNNIWILYLHAVGSRIFQSQYHTSQNYKNIIMVS